MGGSDAARRQSAEEESDCSPGHREGKHPKRAHLPILRALSHAHSRACSATGRLVLYCFGGWVEDAGITLHISALTHVQLFFSPLSLWRHPFAPPHWCYPPISGLSLAAPGQLVACLQPLSALLCLRLSPLPLSSFNSRRMISIQEARGTFQRG